MAKLLIQFHTPSIISKVMEYIEFVTFNAEYHSKLFPGSLRCYLMLTIDRKAGIGR